MLVKLRSSLEACVDELLNRPFFGEHSYTRGEKDRQCPQDPYPEAITQWRSPNKDLETICETLDQQFQPCMFKSLAIGQQRKARVGSAFWMALDGGVTKDAQVDWDQKHSQILCQCRNRGVPPKRSGVKLQYHWSEDGSTCDFQVAMRLVYTSVPQASSVYVIDFFQRRTLSAAAMRIAASKGEQHGAGCVSQFDCVPTSQYTPSMDVHSWLRLQIDHARVAGGNESALLEMLSRLSGHRGLSTASSESLDYVTRQRELSLIETSHNMDYEPMARMACPSTSSTNSTASSFALIMSSHLSVGDTANPTEHASQACTSTTADVTDEFDASIARSTGQDDRGSERKSKNMKRKRKHRRRRNVARNVRYTDHFSQADDLVFVPIVRMET